MHRSLYCLLSSARPAVGIDSHVVSLCFALNVRLVELVWACKRPMTALFYLSELLQLCLLLFVVLSQVSGIKEAPNRFLLLMIIQFQTPSKQYQAISRTALLHSFQRIYLRTKASSTWQANGDQTSGFLQSRATVLITIPWAIQSHCLTTAAIQEAHPR